mmetsp:Transcript_1931/g.3065  ORF Transcript_1931/g.3065 Transcript_1931/m.3065 type:complete len:145 (+) Transcript_1931:67-501(+)
MENSNVTWASTGRPGSMVDQSHPITMRSDYSDYNQPSYDQRGGNGYTPVTYPVPQVQSQGPVYVNARQYARILKRREARMALAKRKKVVDKKNYLHESRHKHACRRPRGPGGRFLTKEELKALAAQQSAEESGKDNNGNPTETV